MCFQKHIVEMMGLEYKRDFHGEKLYAFDILLQVNLLYVMWASQFLQEKRLEPGKLFIFMS